MADIQVINGNMAAAIGAALCRPDIIAAYPITPQTPIVEYLADFVTGGKLDSSVSEVESELSAMSVVTGASLAGSRVFTASASQGLSLMYEPYFRASTLRLPVVMAVANREMISPQTLWGGPQDSLTVRDAGWLQIYVEDNQEILDARRLFADKLKQHKEEIAGEAEQVRQAGGLFIVGTERHDSRRIDNQLRGRAGRQGDPGETRFYISLEDDLMRLFGGERINSIMERMNLDEDTPIENKMLTRAIEQAQTTVESRNFQSRKSVLEYDDVMNKQREIIYDQRKQVLEGMDVKGIIMNMMSTAIGHQVNSAFGGESHIDEAGMRELLRQVEGLYFPRYAVRFEPERIPQLTAEEVIDAFTAAAADFYEKKEQEFTSPVMREVERVVLLRVVDEYWMDHIDAMTDLRQGIGLRAYAQTDPIIAYKKESLEMFEEMISAIQEETVRRLYSVRLRKNEEVKRERVAKTTSESVGGDGTVKKQPRKVKKIGRNDPCPCGSGKKYKNCCGRDA